MRLTRRGRIVRNIIVAIVIYLVVAALLNATLPPECRGVEFHDMTEFCKDISKL